MGRKGSTGLPGKNTMPVLGRPMMVYPILAAQDSGVIDRIYLSTDCEEISEIGKQYGCHPIARPPELCTKQALGEDVYRHAYHVARQAVEAEGESIEFLALFMCNAPTISGDLIRKGVEVLRNDSKIDSAVSVSAYNMWSPLRARRKDFRGLLKPFVPFETFGDPNTLNCDRDSQGDVWYADMGVSIIRPKNLENLERGLLPQKWMGKNIYPLEQWGGCDVDFEWQIPQVEFWLKRHGFSEMPRETGVIS